MRHSFKRQGLRLALLMGGTLIWGWSTRPLSSARFLFGTLVTATLVSVLVSLLPYNHYVQYQTLDGTIFGGARYFYERVNFDPTPIDVLIIGASREKVAIDVPNLESLLRDGGMGDVHVLNLSLPASGDDLHYVLLKEALSTRHPKLVLIGIYEQQARTGHEAFRELADIWDVVAAPLLLNTNYASNLLYMPMRQMLLAWDSIAPGLSGYQTQFDPAHYIKMGIDPREQPGVPAAAPGEKEPKQNPAKDELEASSNARLRRITRPLLPGWLEAIEFAVPRTYLAKMKELCDERGITVAFVYLPLYRGPTEPWDASFYRPLGPILSPTFISQDYTAYTSDAGHLNKRGAERVTRWFANTIADVFNRAH
jgi:hypothetical protein